MRIILRWIAVLPASILALFLSTILLTSVMPFIWQQDINVDGLLYQCLIGQANVFSFVLVGYKIAPSHKRMAGLTLSIMIILIQLIQLYIFKETISFFLEYIEWLSFYKNIGIIMICRYVFSIGSALYLYIIFKYNNDEDILKKIV